MHRFFCHDKSLSQKTISLSDKNEIHHLCHVLRLKPGALVRVFNKNGEEADAVISIIRTSEVIFDIKSPARKSEGSSPQVILACAIPKKAKFEGIIEKTTELGVDEIIPVITARTEVRLNSERGEKKQKRFETVALNAAKQCRRAFIPVIHPVTSFTEVLKALNDQTQVYIACLVGERENLLETLIKQEPKDRTLILIGPEGDFAPHEIAGALKLGCIPVSLGPLTLKVDTAAIMSVALTRISLERHEARR